MSMSVNRIATAADRLGDIVWPQSLETDVIDIQTGDCMLVCAGFEDRSIEVLRRVSKCEIRDFLLGVVNYKPAYQQNKLDEIRKLGRGAGLITKEFLYDRENPALVGEELARFASACNRVVVDISGMSRLLIVQTLVALLSVQSAHVTIIYCEAEEYPPSEDRFRGDEQGRTGVMPSYLSSGIFEIAATPELASTSMLGEAIRLIAFPSFDPEQLTNLIQELQPTYVDLIHGLPPAKKNRWRTEAVRTLNSPIFTSLQGKNDHAASTLDYRETLKILVEKYRDRSMFDRLVVAPTGSKMQTVAVALFRAALYDVQVVYPTPRVFTEPDRYTVGARRLYELELPIQEIRRILS